VKKNKNLVLILTFFVVVSAISFIVLFSTKTQKISKIQRSLFLSTETDVEEELDENVETQLDDLDFSELDNILNDLDDGTFFGVDNFLEIVKKFISAEDSEFFDNFFSYAMSILFDDILELIPYFAIVVALSITYSLITQLSSDKNKSLTNLIHIICFSSIAVIVLKIVLQLMTDVSSTIYSVESQMEIIFPIILTLITAIGSAVTASTFQPLLVVLTSGITKLFVTVLVPIFIFSVVFGVIGNLSNNVRLDKFSKFFSSLFGWIVGIVFTVFIAFLTIHGLTVSSIDSISLKTAKYAIKSYVPVLGSYLSDGISVIIASSVLIKNAVGVAGLMLLFATIFAPILKVVVVILLLKLCSAILEPLCDKQIHDFLYSISKSLNMLTVCLVAVGLMYLISVSILMCCSNIL
jgi:stage III sporulation protein AE